MDKPINSCDIHMINPETYMTFIHMNPGTISLWTQQHSEISEVQKRW